MPKLEYCMFSAYHWGSKLNAPLHALWGMAKLVNYKFHQSKCEECWGDWGEVFVLE